MHDLQFRPDRQCDERYTQKQLLFEISCLLRLILKAVSPAVTQIEIARTGDTVNPIVPGSGPTYLATLTPAVTPVAADVAWISSDPVNAPVTLSSADPTGLTAVVDVPAGTVVPAVGFPFVLTMTYTNADGTTASGTVSDTIVQADVSAVSIARVS